MPPPVPLMVRVWTPVFATEDTVIVIVEVPEPDAAIGFGLNVTF